jgi:hypothetical protein
MNVLKCGACGHTQGKGDWEKAMDSQAKARGATGFVNLSASPQCLACGSTDLHDPSERRTEPEPDSRIMQWCQDLRAASDRFYAGQQANAEARMKDIGRTINSVGGEQLMAQVYWAIKHPPTQRNVNGCWSGIGTWNFSQYD